MLTDRQQEVKDQWIAALRSGEYKQGQGLMYRPAADTYCCLGVLQKEIMGRVEGVALGLPTPLFFSEYPGLDWVYLKMGVLSSMNDAGHYSFKSIADYIEQEWV